MKSYSYGYNRTTQSKFIDVLCQKTQHYTNDFVNESIKGSFKKYVTARGWGGEGIGLFCDKSLQKFWGVGGSHLY